MAGLAEQRKLPSQICGHQTIMIPATIRRSDAAILLQWVQQIAVICGKDR